MEKESLDGMRVYGKRLSKKQGLDLFQRLCEAEGLPIPEREYKFHPERKWRADYYFKLTPFGNIALRRDLLVEIEGGVYTKGRHVRGKGYENDLIKYNAAQLLGYRVFRFTPKMIKNGYALEILKEALR